MREKIVMQVVAILLLVVSIGIATDVPVDLYRSRRTGEVNQVRIHRPKPWLLAAFFTGSAAWATQNQAQYENTDSERRGALKGASLVLGGASLGCLVKAAAESYLGRRARTIKKMSIAPYGDGVMVAGNWRWGR